MYLIRLSAIRSWDDSSVQEPEYNDVNKTRGEEMRGESCSLPITSGHRLFAMNCLKEIQQIVGPVNLIFHSACS